MNRGSVAIALLALASALAAPAPAHAQAPPSYARPTYAIREVILRGRIVGTDGDTLRIENDSGETQGIALMPGTSINLPGQHLQPGMQVAVRTTQSGSDLRAIQIDPSFQPAPEPPALAPPQPDPPPAAIAPQPPEPVAPPPPPVVQHLAVPASSHKIAVVKHKPHPRPATVAARAPRVRATLVPQRAAAPHRSVALTATTRRVVHRVPHIVPVPATRPEPPVWYGWGKL